MDEDGRVDTCCQYATDAEVEEQPDAYDCETCAMRIHQSALGQHDRDCLMLYNLLGRGSVQDLHLTELVFDGLGLSMSRERILDTLDKLELIHKTRPQATSRGPIHQGDEAE